MLSARKGNGLGPGAEYHDKIEILGFVGGSTSLDWIAKREAK